MFSLSSLPTINASLNAASAVCLVAGLICIKRGKIGAHKACMLAALVISMLFLACYLYYHFNTAVLTRFQGTGAARVLYFAILISHTVLAAAVPVLAPITVWSGLKRRDEKHKRIARWTFPIWLYVSVTGVVVYAMLYHVY
jgi:uncharacterized membrane protein YozB (DUF420 family)